MKLSLLTGALPASVLACACACASAPPPAPVVPITPAPPPDPPPVITSACVQPAPAAPTPVNVTLATPTKMIDPAVVAASKRLPTPERTALVTSPTSLKMIDGKLRLHGKSGFASIEVTLPTLTTQCEQTILVAIQTSRPVEVKGTGRAVADSVPGHGYVSAFDLDDVSTCVSR